MLNRTDIAMLWTAGLSAPDDRHVDAVAAVLDTDVVTVNPLGVVEGKDAVLTAFGKSVLAPAFSTGTWSQPSLAGDIVTLTCRFADGAMAASASVHVTVGDDGLIRRVETTIEQTATPATPPPSIEPTWRIEIVDRQVRDSLDQLHPERVRLRPRDLAGTRAAMDLVDGMWAPTLAWARRLPPAKLHERVNGEYSFVETLRHLLFAEDAWLQRMVLGVPDPFHQWGVPPDLPPNAPPDTGPELEEVLLVRTARAGSVRTYLATISDDDLQVRVGGPWDPPGLPTESRARVLDCFRLVFREEWWHHQFATRDLAVLEGS